MARITLVIDDSKAAFLRKKAEQCGILPDQFAIASIEDLIGQPEPAFENAMRKVISKNKELHKRLA
ncbi:MAG: DNA-binding protein [Deltaproteobacteria bacterium]|nr:DNA-binding protein [Deltaproteobacteria bacterium]